MTFTPLNTYISTTNCIQNPILSNNQNLYSLLGVATNFLNTRIYPQDFPLVHDFDAYILIKSRIAIFKIRQPRCPYENPNMYQKLVQIKSDTCPYGREKETITKKYSFKLTYQMKLLKHLISDDTVYGLIIPFMQ